MVFCMNYRRLLYFLAVVDSGTITGAAQELHIAQPALSRQIKNLEAELKLRLFQPQGTRLVLTPSGRAFVPMARRLLVQTRQLESAVEVLRSGSVQKLSCAATSASVRGFLADYISTMSPTAPMILTHTVGHFELEDELAKGVDFIISPMLPSGELASVSLGTVSLRALVGPNHPWHGDGRTTVGIKELCAQPNLILPSHHSISRHLLEESLKRVGATLGGTAECDDGPTLMALAASGRGVGVSTEVVNFGVRALDIVDDVDDPEASGPELAMYMAWYRGHYADQVLRDLAHNLGSLSERQHQP
jgi:DNA-binding transcriptional LysR family regulator